LKNNTVLLVGAGVAAYLLYQRYNAIGNLNFIPRGIQGSGGQLVLLLGVQNPSSAPLSLNSFVGNLVVNGGNAGNVTLFQPVTINPNAETVVPVTIGYNVFGIVQSVLNTAGTDLSQASVVLDGDANIGNQLFPVNLKFN
jgi:LEA14-like dessication related protein